MGNVDTIVPATAGHQHAVSRHRMTIARKAEAIRKAVDAKRSLRTDRIAENFHGLVEEVRAGRGLARAEIAKLAGLGDDTSGTSKRFDKYLLPPECQGEQRTKRVGRLTKKASKFLYHVECLAKALGEDEKGFIVRAFEGTDYGEEPGPLDWERAPWEGLADLLRGVARLVILQADVQGYWDKVMRLPGSYDVRSGTISTSPYQLHCHGYPLAGNTICSDEVPPTPSVLLGRLLQADPAEGKVILGDGEPVTAMFKLWREVRLALGPVVSLAAVGPLLESRSVLEAELEGGAIVSFDNPHTDGSDRIRTAFVGAASHPVRVDTPELPGPPYGQAEHSYFAWGELSAAALRRGLSAVPGDWQHAQECAVDRDRDLTVWERPPSWFLWGEPAYHVETAAHTGSLERDLLAECRRLSDALAAHEATVASQVREQHEKTLERLRLSAAALTTNEDLP